MSNGDEWTLWREQWQQQPTVDVEHLSRQVRRKQRQMHLVFGAEVLLALAAAGQVGRLLLDSSVATRWKIWAVMALLLVAAATWMSVRVRRGTWRTQSASTHDLLRLTATRARVGIRLAWLNILSTPVLIAITLPVVWPYLAPSRWQHDPALLHMLVVNTVANGIVFAASLAFCAYFIRRQRKRLRDVEALLQGYRDIDAHPAVRDIRG